MVAGRELPFPCFTVGTHDRAVGSPRGRIQRQVRSWSAAGSVNTVAVTLLPWIPVVGDSAGSLRKNQAMQPDPSGLVSF